ncbi:SAM-dependent methyltransferase [Talaromyces proteolyticus]|uniref:SAM-dependent methyltransferase n=1 Tax=Talaromyces proteolyticus TaxID=1131652 RepID=A0AAD4KF41_9EURO|nr:SAM-dependent methyltransferase [Talaromyces proteolyticus]KAH8690149.1 SAM-dependent methyltransferase [Talaromyces proteolyticus]
MTSFVPIAATAATTIASYSILLNPSQLQIENPQAAHRIKLINTWRIPTGSRVLEIGCGQGTCTTVLAEAVGPNGHVDAIDPGSPDYGTPVTLAQAQAHISSGSLGSRISWHNSQPEGFLAQHPDKSWDFVVLAHCIWYFASSETLVSLLTALKPRAGKLVISEYSLKATERAAIPHVMAAMTRAALEAHNKHSDANIRCLSSPSSIKDAAKTGGWKLEEESFIIPEEDLQDGRWETSTVLSTQFLLEIDQHVAETTLKTTLRSSRDAVIEAVGQLNGSKVRTMDVWVAQFQ